MAVIKEIMVEGSKYGDAVVLDEYNGSYRLVAAQKSKKNGTVYQKWCFRQDYVDGKNVPGKAIPVQISLGDEQSAIKVLREVLRELSGGSSGQKQSAPAASSPADDEDIPF
jgi:hypothetical protein